LPDTQNRPAPALLRPAWVQPQDRAMTGPLAVLWVVALLHAAAAFGIVLLLLTEHVLW
jgi:hypothetical protein